eukprot:719902-Prymnesium_polylepis.2
MNPFVANGDGTPPWNAPRRAIAAPSADTRCLLAISGSRCSTVGSRVRPSTLQTSASPVAEALASSSAGLLYIVGFKDEVV